MRNTISISRSLENCSINCSYAWRLREFGKQAKKYASTEAELSLVINLTMLSVRIESADSLNQQNSRLLGQALSIYIYIYITFYSFYSTLFYATLLYSTLLYSTLFYSILFYSILFYYIYIYLFILYYESTPTRRKAQNPQPYNPSTPEPPQNLEANPFQPYSR